jgi:very-short-patch-repair endonuclease
VILPVMAATPDLLALLARQDGLITTVQAVQHGLDESVLRRRAREQGWSRVAPRVYLAAGHRCTDRVRIRAAGLWGGEYATVCGPAAAWWHGMLGAAPAQIAVTVPRQLGLRGYPGVRIRRRDLADVDRVRVNGIWCAAAPLATLETAITLPDGSAFLDRALQKHVRFEQLYQAYCRNMGAYGAARAGALLAAAADRADSAAERRLITILRSAGLTGWQRGVPFERWTIDVAFPDAKVAIEFDGWAYHSDVERFRADRSKGNALVRAGWRLLRFTWHDLVNRPQYVIAEIRAALLAAQASA